MTYEQLKKRQKKKGKMKMKKEVLKYMEKEEFEKNIERFANDQTIVWKSTPTWDADEAFEKLAKAAIKKAAKLAKQAKK